MEDLPLFFEEGNKVYSITEITQDIKVLLESNYDHLYVEGEISNFRVPSSGHFYFILKDEFSQLRAVMFRSRNRMVSFEPADGMKVLCRGRITVYEQRGEYQIVVDSIEPRGLGALQIAFDQLKERLRKEGLFDPSRKRPLPFLPRRIAVVTSMTGAAIRDILEILFRRYENMEVLLYPVRVQGVGAGSEIAQAIRDLNGYPGIDLMIVGRGGGSLEDLWAFNEEEVARAIYQSNIPVVSAVGHEIDFTISDFVADLRAPTPSAAAEMVVPEKEALEEELAGLGRQLKRSFGHFVQRNKEEIASFIKRLKDPRRKTTDFRLFLDDLYQRLVGSQQRSLRDKEKNVETASRNVVFLSPVRRIHELQSELARNVERATASVGLCVERSRQEMERQKSLLDSLDPSAVLKRGYGIIRNLPMREIVRDASTLSLGQQLDVQLYKGKLLCRVTKIA